MGQMVLRKEGKGVHSRSSLWFYLLMASLLPGYPWPRFYIDILRVDRNRRRIYLRIDIPSLLGAAMSLGVKRKLDMRCNKVWEGYQNSMENPGGTTASEEREREKQKKRVDCRRLERYIGGSLVIDRTTETNQARGKIKHRTFQTVEPLETRTKKTNRKIVAP